MNDETATTDPTTEPDAPGTGRHVEEKTLATRSGDAPSLAFGDAWDYAPAPERAPVEIADSYGLFINGGFVKGKESYETINPATEQPLARITEASAKDVDKAVIAATEAQREWRRLPANERGKYLYRIARRIQERARELAILETMDGGKPIKESRDADIPLVAQSFFYHAGWADKLRYAFPGRRARSSPSASAGRSSRGTSRCSCSRGRSPRPSPAGTPASSSPPRRRRSPPCASRRSSMRSGCPGVVNIVTGDGEPGAALASTRASTRSRSRLDGGRQTPREDRRGTACASRSNSGGKSPNIIFEDASIDQAIEGIIQGIYFNQGHVCCAGSRLFVQESIATRSSRS